jgi:hypothetical protein
MQITGSGPVAILNTETILAAKTTPEWQLGHRMNCIRECLSAVLLPDSGILALGGAMDGYAATVSTMGPAMSPELLYPADPTGRWIIQNPQGSSRAYHSTAALLPSGRVVSSGGDIRQSDHEVFTPSYLIGTWQPTFQGTFAGPGAVTLFFDTAVFVDCDAGSSSLSRIVLMRPCSVTHHSDFDQRYIELRPEPWPADSPRTDSAGMWVRTPAAPVTGSLNSRVEALPGYYMMFLISEKNIPSAAKWVKLQ